LFRILKKKLFLFPDNILFYRNNNFYTGEVRTGIAGSGNRQYSISCPFIVLPAQASACAKTHNYLISNLKYTTMDNYLIRRATKDNDDQQLKALYSGIFLTEDVGGLAEILYSHYPGMKKEYWYIAEDRTSSAMVSVLALIPWTWEMEGIRLKVAEMGMVGTHEEHRGRGLQKMLNREFDRTLQEEQYDLAVIQGIPGFYHKFGYHYAVGLENHIVLPPDTIPDAYNSNEYEFRLAGQEDIPFLMKEDETYRSRYLVSSVRDESQWKYIMTYGLKTDCKAEFWIMQPRARGEAYYFKIPWLGFGTGLVVSEVSESISLPALHNMLWFCRQKALERGKPYIRVNMHNRSALAAQVIATGVPESKTYAWQVKIPDKIRLLDRLRPLFEKRMEESVFKGFSGVFRLNFFSGAIDMNWDGGRLESVKEGGEGECPYTFCISNDLFPSLVLGHRSWQELQYFCPEVSPELLYIRPTADSLNDKTGLFVDTLFPARKSWVYQSY
jgi:hypothetical protein